MILKNKKNNNIESFINNLQFEIYNIKKKYILILCIQYINI